MNNTWNQNASKVYKTLKNVDWNELIEQLDFALGKSTDKHQTVAIMLVRYRIQKLKNQISITQEEQKWVKFTLVGTKIW